MCDFILTTGERCFKAPSKVRCYKHGIVVRDLETAVKQVRDIFTPPISEDVSCPCGYVCKYWNIRTHFRSNMHAKWVSATNISTRELYGLPRVD